MQEKDKSTLLDFTGVIVPTQFNRHGRAIEIGLETETFDRYIINQGNSANELMSHLFCEADVSATLIGESSEGDPIIQIDTYRINQRINSNNDSM